MRRIRSFVICSRVSVPSCTGQNRLLREILSGEDPGFRPLLHGSKREVEGLPDPQPGTFPSPLARVKTSETSSGELSDGLFPSPLARVKTSTLSCGCCSERTVSVPSCTGQNRNTSGRPVPGAGVSVPSCTGQNRNTSGRPVPGAGVSVPSCTGQNIEGTGDIEYLHYYVSVPSCTGQNPSENAVPTGILAAPPACRRSLTRHKPPGIDDNNQNNSTPNAAKPSFESTTLEYNTTPFHTISFDRQQPFSS